MEMYKVVDCNKKDVSFNWHAKIDRSGGKNGRTDNNLVIVRLNPLMMMDIQSKRNTLTESTEIKKLICEALKMDWKDEYTHESAIPYQEPKVVTNTRDLKTEVEAMIQKDQCKNVLELNTALRLRYQKLEKVAPITKEQEAGKIELRNWLIENSEKLTFYTKPDSIFNF